MVTTKNVNLRTFQNFPGQFFKFSRTYNINNSGQFQDILGIKWEFQEFQDKHFPWSKIRSPYLYQVAGPSHFDLYCSAVPNITVLELPLVSFIWRYKCRKTPAVLTLRYSSDPSIKDKPPLGYWGKKRNTNVNTNDILRLLEHRNIIDVL